MLGESLVWADAGGDAVVSANTTAARPTADARKRRWTRHAGLTRKLLMLLGTLGFQYVGVKYQLLGGPSEHDNHAPAPDGVRFREVEVVGAAHGEAAADAAQAD